MTDHPTRRNMLATIAAAAAAMPMATVPALASASAEPDPIFAAIEAHRASIARQKAAQAAAPVDEGLSPKEWSVFTDEEFDLSFALVETNATTVAGMAALLAYVVEASPVVQVWPVRDGETVEEKAWVKGKYSGISFEFDVIKVAAEAFAMMLGGEVER